LEYSWNIVVEGQKGVITVRVGEPPLINTPVTIIEGMDPCWIEIHCPVPKVPFFFI
jgi:hypothetical protein